MSSIKDFISFIQKESTGSNASRLCLRNYFAHLSTPEANLTLDHFESFFQRSLTFPFWQENKIYLLEDTNRALIEFSKSYGIDFDPSPLNRYQKNQIIQFEHLDQFALLVEKWSKSRFKNLKGLKVKKDRDESVISIHLLNDGGVRVYFYWPIAEVYNAEIYPLCHEYNIEFNSDLEISTGHIHTLPLSRFSTARFQVSDQGVGGHIVRGYTLNKMGSFRAPKLSQVSEVFYAVKRLERFFVHRPSDPIYRDLTALLEKAFALIQAKHPDSRRFGMKVLDRGQKALENMYPDDKLLFLLLKELDRALQAKESDYHEPYQFDSPQ